MRLPAAATGSLLAFLLLLVACGADERDGPTTATAEAAGAGDDSGERRSEAGLDLLLVTIDTLRADALGAYGNPRAATPWMDRLAAAGVRFTNARAHNVTTLPSHATILSGLLPQRHGVRDNSGFRFPAEVETLATLLADHGYRTGAFISAFPLDSRFGLARGFEVYEDSFVGAGARAAFLEQERPGADTVALARRWLAQADDRPAFAWVHLYEPHFPYAPPPPLAERFADDPYAGDVAAADAALEPLLRPLLDSGGAADTLVVLTSDHGESLGEHGEATHGLFVYEAAIRVPLVLYQPRLLESRSVADDVRLVDVMPTILDLLALPVPAGISGRSLVGLARGESGGTAPPTYVEALSGQLNRGWAPLFGVVHDGWKYIQLPVPELYDLASDPREETNLALVAAQRKSELQRAIGLQEALAGYRAADVGAERLAEDADTRSRLRALGYLGASAAPRASYTIDDDPKRLIALDAALREVNGLYAAGDLAAARDRCRQLVELRPGMRVALMTLAQIERDLGNLDAAIDAMRRAFELNPEDAAALAQLTSYLTQAGRAADAVSLTQAHAGSTEPDLDVLFTRSLALARTGRFDDAFDALARAREIDPLNPVTPVYRGTLHLLQGERNRARDAYREALDLNPHTVRAHSSLAMMATEEGRMEEAVSHWRDAVRLDPAEHAKLLASAARLWSGGQRAQARPLLELFARSAPSALYAEELERVRELLATTTAER